MTKSKRLFVAFVFPGIIGIGVFAIIGIASIYKPYPEPIVKFVPVIDPNYVQCPAEAQERLKAQGLYDGKIDGIWGPETDRAYCDWCAIQTFKPDYLEK